MEPKQPEHYVLPEDCKIHQWYDMGVGGRCYKCGVLKSDVETPVEEPVVEESVEEVSTERPVVETVEVSQKKRGRPKKVKQE